MNIHIDDVRRADARTRALQLAKRGAAVRDIVERVGVLSTSEVEALVAQVQEHRRQDAASVLARSQPSGFCRGEALQLSLDAGDDDGEPVWIQLAKPGTFRGHPSGKPFTLNRSVFEQIIANFRGNKDGRLPIDFEHASEQDSAEGSIPMSGAPAQGWIVDMKIEVDGNLWAKVEWGKLAREYIREGQYRYISPAIHLRMKDRETGLEIGAYVSSAGLTNQPFLDGMRPLAARRDGGGIVDAPVLSHTALTAKLVREGVPYRQAQDEASRQLRGRP
jgi:hypothetical protein